MIKKFLKFMSILVLLACTLCGCLHAPSKLEIKSGTLDLSQWDFTQEPLIKLTGEWNLFNKELITTQSLQGGKSVSIKVPNDWTSIVGTNGYATYHLKILPPQNKNESLSIYLKNALNSYKVYANGKLLFQGGEVGKSKSESIPFLKFGSKALPENKEIDIYIQVSNFHHARGGLTETPVLGLSHKVDEYIRTKRQLDFFIIGLIFVIGLYHLLLFVLRSKNSKDMAPLYLSLFSFLIAIKTLLTGQYPEEWFPNVHLWSFYLKAEYLGLYLGIPIFSAFLYQLYPKVLSGKLVRFIQISGLCLSAIVLFFPATIFGKTLIPFQVLVATSCLYYTVIFIWYSFLSKNLISSITSIGLLILITTIFNDMLYAFQIINTDYLIHLGLAGFCLAQVAVLAINNTQTRNDLEVLSQELQNKNEALRDLNFALEKSIKRLESLLTGTKEMAMEHERFSAIQSAIKYLVNEIELSPKYDVMSYIKKEGSRSEIENSMCYPIVKDGVFMKEVQATLAPLDELLRLDRYLMQKKTLIIEDHTLFIPLFWGEGLVGFITIKGYEQNSMSDFDRSFIDALASSLAVAIENISFLMAMKERAQVDAELKAAELIQKSLLPSTLDIAEVKVRTFYQSATMTGGDWYGYFHDKKRNKLNIYVADVTGHGIPSAILTGVVSGSIYSTEPLLEQIHFAGKDTAEDRLRFVANVLNDVIYQTSKEEQFLALTMISLDLTSGEVVYINAGHKKPIWIQLSKRETKAVSNPGMWLGYPKSPDLKSKTFQLEKGDMLFIYTDGLVENQGPSGDSYSERKLRVALVENKDIDVIHNNVIGEAKNIWQDSELGDDVTFLLLQWNGLQAVAPSPCEEAPSI